MTGTKVVKLKLDGNAAGKLPELRDRIDESVFSKAFQLFESTPYPNEWEYHRSLIGSVSDAGLDTDNVTLQAVIDSLEKDHAGEKFDEEVEEMFGNVGSYHNKAGLLYTALIQASSRNEFEITLRKRVNFLGRLLDSKKVVVNGDVGHKLGSKMKAGEIVVNGNAGLWVGSDMAGGKIRIRGNSDSFAGSWAKAGGIIVEGDAGTGTGDGLCGGNVIVMGDAKGRTGHDASSGVIDVKGKINRLSKKVGPSVTILEGGKQVKK
ncbi:MAG: hypothetical protein V1921_06535 [Candidatus Altiarchaeota archaeon]